MNPEAVFKGKTQPLDTDGSKMLIRLIMTELDGKEISLKGEGVPFFSQIIRKRIDAFNLPIEFTANALLAVNAFVDRPASAVVLLIDALTRHEGKKVTVRMLCDLYPEGFYAEETLIDYIDNHLKPRKTRWSEIY